MLCQIKLIPFIGTTVKKYKDNHKFTVPISDFSKYSIAHLISTLLIRFHSVFGVNINNLYSTEFVVLTAVVIEVFIF
jgi:hypothetical protein